MSRWGRRFAYRAKEAVLDRGTFRVLAELERGQWRSREELQDVRWRALGEVVRAARENVPLYQDHWRDVDLDAALRDPRAFAANVPLLTKADMRASQKPLIVPHMRGHLMQSRTSGSSGEALYMAMDTLRMGWSAAARIRAWHRWGLDYGHRNFRLVDAPWLAGLGWHGRLTSYGIVVSNYLSGIHRISAFENREADLERHRSELIAMQPEAISGYGGALVSLADYVLKQGAPLSLPTLKVAIYTAEAIYQAGRRLIGEAFGAPVASDYACREFGLVAHECPAGSLHISEENLFIETVDDQGRPVSGQPGYLVMTDLRMSRTPFVRYWLGDVAELAPDDFRCPCGSPLRVLKPLVGRATELIPRQDGSFLHPLALERLTFPLPEVSHWQTRVSPPDRLRFLIETTPERLAPLHGRILAQFRVYAGPDFECSVEAVPELLPEKSGKYARVVFEEGMQPGYLHRDPVS